MTALFLPKPARRGPKPPTRLRRTALPPRSGRIGRKVRVRKQQGGALAAMVREADRLWSLVVRALENNECRPCKHWYGQVHEATDAAHIFRRGRMSTRHVTMNGVPACRTAHDYLGSAAVGKPTRMGRYVISTRGRVFYNDLEKLARKTTKFNTRHLEHLQKLAAALGIAA